jgi:PAS domain S-box-containing protein
VAVSPSASERGGARAPQARLKRSRRRAALFVCSGLAGVALLLGVLNFYARASAVFPDVGAKWAETPDGIIAVEVHPTGPAAAAGLRIGDRLVALDGRPPASAREAGEAPWHTDPDQALNLTVERGSRQLPVVVKPNLTAGDNQLYAYLATVGLFFLASGVYLIYRLGVRPVTVRYFVLSLAAFAVLSFSHTGAGGLPDWVFYTVDTAGRVLFPTIMLHFVILFPSEGRLRVPVGLAVYFPAAALAAATVWLVPLQGALRTADPVTTLERLDGVELLYTALWLTASLAVLTVRSTRTTIPSVRRQLRWLSWGLGMAVMPFVILYLIPRALQGDTPPAASLAVLPLIVLPLAFSTAILKYRLADLGLFVKGGVTLLTLTFFSLALFALLNLALRHTLGLPGINNRVFTVLAGILVFLLYPTLRQVVGGIVDRAFYLGRYDYRRTMLEFARELNSERELLPLMLKFHDRIGRTLPVQTSVLLLPDDQRGGLRLLAPTCDLADGREDDLLPADHPVCRRLETEDSVHLGREERFLLPPAARRLGLQELFPMRVKGRVVAALGVSLRDSEEEMNSEDRQLLITLAAHAAAAIEGARLYEENIERIREVGMLKDYNESIVESSRVGILVLDPDHRIRGWNRAMEELFGSSRDEMLSRRVTTVFPDEFLRLLEGVPPGGRRIDRYSLTEEGGTRRTFNLAVSELKGKTGRQRGKVVTFDEVSEQLRMEQQLVQSERMAAVGLLASGVAHEINTPLTGIASYAEMLLDGGSHERPDREILERIRKQSWKASHIANSLLNFSRGSGDDRERVDLSDTVAETLSLFGPQLKGRRIEIVYQPGPGEPPLVWAHRGRLQQVVLNLLLNARDAMPGGGCIRIATARHDGHVELTVADEGEGIPAELQGRIYDPFFTTKGPGKGTGLGLSVTYGIVQDHKGSIQVESLPGEGTRFTVRLPAWQAAEVPV